VATACHTPHELVYQNTAMISSIGFGLLAPPSRNTSKSEKKRRVSWNGRLPTTRTISNPTKSTVYSEPDYRDELTYADLHEGDKCRAGQTKPLRESTMNASQSTALPDKAPAPIDDEGTSGTEMLRTISAESDTQSTLGSLLGKDECWANLMVLCLGMSQLTSMNVIMLTTSVDGDGIRGLSTLFILKELMVQIELLERADGKTNRSASFTTKEELKTGWSSDSEHFLPCHYFDMICGTSTGG
jgi:hypothetical protein